MLLCGEFEDEIVGTRVEKRFFSHVCEFYETAVSKILAKFPFTDPNIKELAFLDPRNRDQCSSTGLIRLATRFTTFDSDEIDTLVMEFRDYRATSLTDLPDFDPNESVAIDHFWANMAAIHSVTDADTYYHILMQIQKGCSVW